MSPAAPSTASPSGSPPADGIEDLVDSYQRSIWADQPHRVELLSEKEALTPIVHRVTKAYQVPLSPCKGTPGGRSGSSPCKTHRGTPADDVGADRHDYDRAGYNMADFGEDTLTNLVGKACRQFDLPMPGYKFDRIWTE